MLMTQFADPTAGETEPGLLRRWALSLQRLFGLEDSAYRPAAMAMDVVETPEPHEAPTGPILHVVDAEPDAAAGPDGFRWRRHPQLLNHRGTPDETGDQREARHDAVRGLYAARAGALEVAVEHFTRAARCPEIDLSHIPGFWQLSRSAMMTAVDAYEEVGRIRDAAALNARIRTMFRPRALTPVPGNVTQLPERKVRISSNS